MLAHKHGKTVRYEGKKQWLHLRDLCTVLGLSLKPNLKNKPTMKFRAVDTTNRNQLATYVHKSCVETFLGRSKQTDKVVWLREEVFGIKPPRTPDEEKFHQPPVPEPTPKKNPNRQILDLQFCLADIYENFALTRHTKARIRELVPDLKPPETPLYRFHVLEVDTHIHMTWLLRKDGRAFVDLDLVLELLESPEPLEAYTEDETFLTVTRNCVKVTCYEPYEDADTEVHFIEIKHLRTLEEHAGRTHHLLQEAIKKILRALPGEN